MNEHEMRIAELQRRLTQQAAHCANLKDECMRHQRRVSEAMQRASVAESSVADLEVQLKRAAVCLTPSPF